jgi:hypothetical protein
MGLVDNGERFPLLDRMAVAMPLQEIHTLAMFSGPGIGIDVQRLAYFALSVFWRASAHRWHGPHGGTVWNDLGPYQEMIRQYLLGEAAFPADVAVPVVACTDYESQNSFYSPCQIKGHKVPGFGILVRGIHFRMFVGPEIPQPLRNSCCVTSARSVILRGSCRHISVHAFAYLHATARPSRSLRE